MKYTLTIPPVAVGREKRRIPYSPNKQLFWATKGKWKKAWENNVYWTMKEASIPRMKRAKATFILYAVKEQDYDNCVASLKGCVDGIKHFLPDDSNKYLNLVVKQIKVEHREDKKVKLIIENL